MRCKNHVDPWVGKIPWRKEWQPTPVFLPGKSHGQWSLVGYGPQDHKELDTTEVTYHVNMLYISNEQLKNETKEKIPFMHQEQTTKE